MERQERITSKIFSFDIRAKGEQKNVQETLDKTDQEIDKPRVNSVYSPVRQKLESQLSRLKSTTSSHIKTERKNPEPHSPSFFTNKTREMRSLYLCTNDGVGLQDSRK